jgi:[acyl-carrier-protein] S-malonyltransferase
MMAPAAETLKAALSGTKICSPDGVKVVANISSEYYNSPESIRQGLVKQLIEPILWEKCMDRLIADGVETFYEIGPGRVLTGLLRKVNRRANIINIGSEQSLAELK